MHSSPLRAFLFCISLLYLTFNSNFNISGYNKPYGILGHKLFCFVLFHFQVFCLVWFCILCLFGWFSVCFVLFVPLLFVCHFVFIYLFIWFVWKSFFLFYVSVLLSIICIICNCYSAILCNNLWNQKIKLHFKMFITSLLYYETASAIINVYKVSSTWLMECCNSLVCRKTICFS